MLDLAGPLLRIWRCHRNHYVPLLLRGEGRVVLMLAPEHEVDVTNYNGVVAHFTCIYYMPA